MPDDEQTCPTSLRYVVQGSVQGSSGVPHKCILPADHKGAHEDALGFSWTGYPFHVVTSVS